MTINKDKLKNLILKELFHFLVLDKQPRSIRICIEYSESVATLNIGQDVIERALQSESVEGGDKH